MHHVVFCYLTICLQTDDINECGICFNMRLKINFENLIFAYLSAKVIQITNVIVPNNYHK